MKDLDQLTEVQRNTLLPSFPNLKPKLLRVEVVFGAPGNRCQGNGICRMVASPVARRAEKLPCHFVRAYLRHLSGAIQLLVPKRKLCPNLQRTQFGGPAFLVTESFRFSEELITAMGLPMDMIPPGSYPIVENAGFFQILFPLAKLNR